MARACLAGSPGSYLRNTSYAAITSYPFTVFAWFNSTTNDPAANSNVFNVGSSAGGAAKDNIGFNLGAGTNNFSSYVSDPSGIFYLNTAVAITPNVWHSAAFVGISVSSRSLYIDGAFANTNSSTAGAFGSNSTTTWIGNYEDSNGFSGSIAEVSVWNVALTANEIASLNSGVRAYTIRRLALTGYWPLDGLSSPEPDLSGNAHNMALVNAPALANGPPIGLWTPKTHMHR
jgi:Concanavalin A-like lectin/glucanases superfamily